MSPAGRTVGGHIYSPTDRPGQDLHNCHFQKRVSGLQTIWHLGLGGDLSFLPRDALNLWHG